jgi:hypothetical protein
MKKTIKLNHFEESWKNELAMRELIENEFTLKDIKKWAIEIASEWDGDLPGSAEERAHQASDILLAVENLEELMGGMENL